MNQSISQARQSSRTNKQKIELFIIIYINSNTLLAPSRIYTPTHTHAFIYILSIQSTIYLLCYCYRIWPKNVIK